MVGRFCIFSFTNTKKLAMLLCGALLVTMHVFELGDIICCLYFWYFGMCLKEYGLEPKILRIMGNVHCREVTWLGFC